MRNKILLSVPIDVTVLATAFVTLEVPADATEDEIQSAINQTTEQLLAKPGLIDMSIDVHHDTACITHVATDEVQEMDNLDCLTFRVDRKRPNFKAQRTVDGLFVIDQLPRTSDTDFDDSICVGT